MLLFNRYLNLCAHVHVNVGVCLFPSVCVVCVLYVCVCVLVGDEEVFVSDQELLKSVKSVVKFLEVSLSLSLFLFCIRSLLTIVRPAYKSA